MPFDRELLAYKLKNYREQFQVSIQDLSEATGIDVEALEDYEKQERLPSGDEILILADFFKCDYKFFISNERLAPFEETETLFRRYGDELSREDRWSIQEVLYMAECEKFLDKILGKNRVVVFVPDINGTYFKGHGISAAKKLRAELGYTDVQVPLNIYDDFRKIGIYVFRRKLVNNKISGIYIKHPMAGNCILINYLEDIYRQRFTAAHEAAHAIFDHEDKIIVSFTSWETKDLIEIRANNFASHYLMPPEFLKRIPDSTKWNSEKAIHWANQLKVSTEALAYALKAAELINEETERLIKTVRVPKDQKIDPELPKSLSRRALEYKTELLRKGLSSNYVRKCFEACRANKVSVGRAAEMLLINESELRIIAETYGENLNGI